MKNIIYILTLIAALAFPALGARVQTDYLVLRPVSLPAGGTTGQLAVSSTDNNLKIYKTSWGNPAAGISALDVKTKTGNYTLTVSDQVILGDATGGIFNLYLYTASGNAGNVVELKKIDASDNRIMVYADGAETIDGGTTFSLYDPYESSRLVADGTSSWKKLGGIKFDNLITSPQDTGVIQTAAVVSGAGTPSVVQQTGTWIDSITDVAGGQWILNVTAGIFDNTPMCVCSILGNTTSGLNCHIMTASTSAVQVRSVNMADAASDQTFTINCSGIK